MRIKYLFGLVAFLVIGFFPRATGWAAAPSRSITVNSRSDPQLLPFNAQGASRINWPEQQSAPFRFAVIGDYGADTAAEADVAALIKSWNPDIIVTTGDNNYNEGAASTIDANIGKYFHEYIYPYKGSYGAGAQVNRFFPSLGNHDWNTVVNGLPQPYLDYFTLPGNERYYDFVWDLVHFFVLDSDPSEPDGDDVDSVQAKWLEANLASSSRPWKIVVMHHAPYSSGSHGSISKLQWPFAEWGADAVLSGHDHTYERISRDGILYFVNGLGGRSIYDFSSEFISGSQAHYNGDYGAMLVNASFWQIQFQFINRQAEIIDDVSLYKEYSFSFLPVLQKALP